MFRLEKLTDSFRSKIVTVTEDELSSALCSYIIAELLGKLLKLMFYVITTNR